MTSAHIIQSFQVKPRPVLVRPPGDDISIPTPGMLLAQHVAGGHVYACEVAFWNQRHAIVLPTWIEERSHVPAH